MSRARRSPGALLRRSSSARSLRLGAGVCLSWGLLACAGGDPRQPLPIDCSINDDYDIRVLQPLEGEGTNHTWFGYGDDLVDDPVPVLVPLPEGRCESTAALFLESDGHDDWGAGFGEYMMPMVPADATGYEGVSFWARATGFGKSRGFLFNINDRNTNPMGGSCVEPMATDVLSGGYTYNEGGMIVPLGGDLPSPTDCGNTFQRPVFARPEWYLHRLPFESFQQQANPNRVPTGLDRSGIYQFTITIPKDSDIELWIDDIGVYRKREPAE